MSRVVFFEICAEDLDAAAEFYSRVFGWEIKPDQDDPDVWSIATANGDDDALPGALTRYEGDEYNTTVNTIEIPSLQACAEEITRAGGMVLAPPTEIAGHGRVQYCQDLEGNVFGILERTARS